MPKTFIIAEAGVNHNGNIDFAFQLVDIAKSAGADAVKFQTFKTESICCKNAGKAEYQKINSGANESQYEMLKKLELSYSAFEKIKRYCDDLGILFLSTPFDLESVAFLNDIGMTIFKIPSGEITNVPYLRGVGRTKKTIILSTGMAELKEVEFAINTIKQTGNSEISLLHCTTMYPTPPECVNLKVMDTLYKTFGFPVGLSDHTEGIAVSIGAVALGATIIEKHFTLDKNMQGPDHRASLAPNELKDLVQGIRIVEKAIEGNGQKSPNADEESNKKIVRKIIYASTTIQQGDLITEKNIIAKRPASGDDGISPILWDFVINRRSLCLIKEGSPISLDVLE